MEERILKRTALTVMAAAIAACILVPALPYILKAADALAVAMEDEQTKEEKKKRKMSGVELLEYNNGKAEEEWEKDALLADGLRLELPLGVTGNDLEVAGDYLTQTVTVSIPYAGESYLYDYPMLGQNDIMESIDFESQKKYGILKMKMNQVYELNTSYNEDYFYIEFLTPHEVYDKVIVIDAGHGGEDFGVVKMGISEKDIDLDIVLKLKEIFDEANDTSVGVYYTRTTDTDLDAQIRKRLARKTNADFFVSVHNSSTQSGMMSSIHGTQVMYDETVEGSQRLAQIFQKEITDILESSDKGIRPAEEADDFGDCGVPAVQIEVGFMTNQAELASLCSQEYQKKAAQGIYQALLAAIKETD